MVTKNNFQSSKKPLIIGSLIVLALIIFAGILYSQNQRNKAGNPADTTESGGINLSPPTEEDIEETKRNKERIIKDQEKSEAQSAQPNQTVTPIIGYVESTDNGNVQANGYVPGIFEEDGTCTLTLELQGTKVTTSKKAMPDAQSTVCGLMTIERNKLNPGEWTATLTYSSPKHFGTSQERKVSVK